MSFYTLEASQQIMRWRQNPKSLGPEEMKQVIDTLRNKRAPAAEGAAKTKAAKAPINTTALLNAKFGPKKAPVQESLVEPVEQTSALEVESDVDDDSESAERDES